MKRDKRSTGLITLRASLSYRQCSRASNSNQLSIYAALELICRVFRQTITSWDNAVAGSFFASLSKERIKKRIYNTREMATIDVSDYIEAFYNPPRRHSHIGGVSPDDFEAAAKRA
jgi:transposase InsO family protein